MCKNRNYDENQIVVIIENKKTKKKIEDLKNWKSWVKNKHICKIDYYLAEE